MDRAEIKWSRRENKVYTPRSFLTSSSLMKTFTFGLLLLFMPGALLGLAKHRAPSRSRRRKKPLSLHSTVCCQPRDTADAAPPPEPRAGRNITAHRSVKKSLRLNCATEPHPKLELLLPEGDILLGFMMTALSVDPFLFSVLSPHTRR